MSVGSVVALPQLPLADGAFDLVIVVMVMQHLDDRNVVGSGPPLDDVDARTLRHLNTEIDR